LLLGGLRRSLAPGAAAVARAALAATYCALVLHTLVYAAYLEDPLSWVLLAIAAALRARPAAEGDADKPADAAPAVVAGGS
jgi:putative inorganic carbon (hco3(-)) transporter